MPFQKKSRPPVPPGATLNLDTGDIIMPPGTIDAALSSSSSSSQRHPNYYLKTHLRYPSKPQQPVSLSHKAYAYLQSQSALYLYNGRSTTTGLTHYLLALFRANPVDTYSDIKANWRDTRPAYLRDSDPWRTNLNRTSRLNFLEWLPYAQPSPEYERIPRKLNLEHYTQLAPQLLRLSDYFLISSTRGLTTKPHLRVYATLEAIGLQHLTPVNPPLPNPRPVSPRNRRRYALQAANERRNVELVF